MGKWVKYLLIGLFYSLPVFATSGHQMDMFASGISSQGIPLSGGYAIFLIPGTSVTANIYSDISCLHPLSNPVQLNTSGAAQIYGNRVYKIIITDSDHVPFAVFDQFDYSASGVNVPTGYITNAMMSSANYTNVHVPVTNVTGLGSLAYRNKVLAGDITPNAVTNTNLATGSYSHITSLASVNVSIATINRLYSPQISCTKVTASTGTVNVLYSVDLSASSADLDNAYIYDGEIHGLHVDSSLVSPYIQTGTLVVTKNFNVSGDVKVGGNLIALNDIRSSGNILLTDGKNVACSSNRGVTQIGYDSGIVSLAGNKWGGASGGGGIQLIAGPGHGGMNGNIEFWNPSSGLIADIGSYSDPSSVSSLFHGDLRTSSNLYVTGICDIKTAVTIGGYALFKYPTHMESYLKVSGNATFSTVVNMKSDLNVSGNTTLQDPVHIIGDITVSGNGTYSSKGLFYNDLESKGSLYGNNRLAFRSANPIIDSLQTTGVIQIGGNYSGRIMIGGKDFDNCKTDIYTATGNLVVSFGDGTKDNVDTTFYGNVHSYSTISANTISSVHLILTKVSGTGFSGSEGEIYYNTSDGYIYIRISGNWVKVN